ARDHRAHVEHAKATEHAFGAHAVPRATALALHVNMLTWRDALRKARQRLTAAACPEAKVSDSSSGLASTSGSSLRSRNRPPDFEPTKSSSSTSTEPRRIVVTTLPCSSQPSQQL